MASDRNGRAEVSCTETLRCDAWHFDSGAVVARETHNKRTVQSPTDCLCPLLTHDISRSTPRGTARETSYASRRHVR